MDGLCSRISRCYFTCSSCSSKTKHKRLPAYTSFTPFLLIPLLIHAYQTTESSSPQHSVQEQPRSPPIDQHFPHQIQTCGICTMKLRGSIRSRDPSREHTVGGPSPSCDHHGCNCVSVPSLPSVPSPSKPSTQSSPFCIFRFRAPPSSIGPPLACYHGPLSILLAAALSLSPSRPPHRLQRSCVLGISAHLRLVFVMRPSPERRFPVAAPPVSLTR